MPQMGVALNETIIGKELMKSSDLSSRFLLCIPMTFSFKTRKLSSLQRYTSACSIPSYEPFTSVYVD